MTDQTTTQAPATGCVNCGGTCRTYKDVWGWWCTKCIHANGRVPCRHGRPKVTVPYKLLPMVENYQARYGLDLDEAVSRILAAGLQAMYEDHSFYIDPAERYAESPDDWTAA